MWQDGETGAHGPGAGVAGGTDESRDVAQV